MPDQQSRLFDLIEQVAQAGHDLASRDEALEAVTRAAKETIPDVDSVSISTRLNGDGFKTLAPTDDLALSGDKLQYALNEGPCVDAAGGESMLRTGDLGRDDRWSHYGPRASNELGVTSQLALEMFSAGTSYGGINLYSLARRAFNDDESLSYAELFASQAAVLMGRTAGDRQLTQGLASRESIGRATGIIMERYGLDQHRAFQFLVRLSSIGNIKLRDVADELNQAANDKATGEILQGAD